VTAPSAGGEYLSDKFNEFVEETRVEVRVDNIRETESGYVAADLTISEAGVAVKYNVYLRKDHILLLFASTDRSRAELAALLLRHAGVDAEVKKEDGRDVWYVTATTNKLAAGREELRKALAKIVETARREDNVDANKAKRWLKKLEKGRMLREGWPEYFMTLVDGALMIRFASTDPDSIAYEKQQLENMGLEEGKHFSVKMPKDGKKGYVYILKEGLAYAAWLSVRGEGEQQKLAAEFVKHILRRAEKAGKEVLEKVQKIIEEGKTRGSTKLESFEGRVEVNGKTYVVKVEGGEAKLEKSESGKLLLRIKITAEVDGVRCKYVITYIRQRTNNAAVGYAYASGITLEDRRADAERFAAVVKALTGREPRIIERSDGSIELRFGREHLEGFMRFAELADAIEEWLEETE
jgi:hypothetical protein